jgi:hypothetical protein
MKTYSRSILYVSILTLLILASCSKDDDPATKTKTDLLVQNTWKFKAALPSDDIGAQFIAAFYQNSEYTFKKDKTYTGSLLTISISGKWEFAENEAQLILDKGDTGELKFKVKTLDDSNLELTAIDPDNTTEITYQYVKK